MNTIHRLLSDTPSNSADKRTLAHVVIWVLVTLAALLLVGFTAVVDDFTQHGEMRRMQQRVTGSFVLPGEVQSGGLDVASLLSSREENLLSR